jgi:hypothetical protein
MLLTTPPMLLTKPLLLCSFFFLGALLATAKGQVDRAELIYRQALQVDGKHAGLLLMTICSTSTKVLHVTALLMQKY